ncbi:IclR family transcriptional regulator C-terminal domain-containing protein [Escherichia coli]|nr:IclR family transcriptional regulator C-terminal domain-containing protein [Escherichia coli]
MPACLATCQPVQAKSIIEELVWEQMTPTTITHPQRLYEELARIRRQGLELMTAAKTMLMSVVSPAPVFNANNEAPPLPISVVSTRLQINEEYRDYLAGKAIACARDISRLLGWKSPFDLQAS